MPGYNSADRRTQADGGVVIDQHSHGTHVAGCGAAIGNNGVGVAGVGWNLGIMPIRATGASAGGAGGTSLEAILHGAEWAVQNGARSASCSWTGVESPAVGDSGTFIKSVGGLLLYAADNNGRDHRVSRGPTRSLLVPPIKATFGLASRVSGVAWTSSRRV